MAEKFISAGTYLKVILIFRCSIYGELKEYFNVSLFAVLPVEVNY